MGRACGMSGVKRNIFRFGGKACRRRFQKDLGMYWMIILKWIFKKQDDREWTDSRGLGKEQVASCCENVAEHLASIKCGPHREWLKILACWEGSCFMEYVLVVLFIYIIY
jgi:hypothetical protein